MTNHELRLIQLSLQFAKANLGSFKEIASPNRIESHERKQPVLTAEELEEVLQSLNDVYANVGWTPNDVTSVADVDVRQARDFLRRHEQEIQEGMTLRGWEILDESARLDRLPPANDDLDDEIDA